jgi:hypothetical protein
VKREDQSAIAEYFQGGGEIQRVQGPIRINERELIDYLASCGFPVKYFAGDTKPYACNGKRYSLDKIVRFANEQRRLERLPPIML